MSRHTSRPQRSQEPEPSRWVMVGWRSAEKVGLTRDQINAVINDSQGPCARCGASHHRYGPGGQPLCSACRAK